MSRRDARKRLLAFEKTVYNPARAWLRDQWAVTGASYRNLDAALNAAHAQLLREAQDTGPASAGPVVRDPD